jgi:hypothetical protein
MTGCSLVTSQPASGRLSCPATQPADTKPRENPAEGHCMQCLQAVGRTRVLSTLHENLGEADGYAQWRSTATRTRGFTAKRTTDFTRRKGRSIQR